MMKKAILYGISLFLALSLTACGGSNDNTADSTPNASTPAVTEPANTSTPEITPAQDVESSAPTETPATEGEQAQELEQEAELFTSVSETVYATTTVNVRDTYSSSGNKLGSLTKAQPVTRTGVGQGKAAGWSKVEFNGQVAYVSSDYLSTTKPVIETNTSSNSGGTSSGGGTSNSSPSYEPGSDVIPGNTNISEEEMEAIKNMVEDAGGTWDPATDEELQEAAEEMGGTYDPETGAMTPNEGSNWVI